MPFLAHIISGFSLLLHNGPALLRVAVVPRVILLLKRGLNEGGARIIWEQRKTRHLKRTQKATSNEPEWPQ